MIDPNVKLTEHFTLKEMTASKSYPTIKNVPPVEKIDNLRTLCEWLEDLRAAYNRRYGPKERPLVINSGYRSPMLNKAVGGALHSNHLDGCAADINCGGKTANDRAKEALRYALLLLQIAEARNERFDELIIERRGASWWVHFAVRPGTNRMWITVINKSS